MLNHQADLVIRYHGAEECPSAVGQAQVRRDIRESPRVGATRVAIIASGQEIERRPKSGWNWLPLVGVGLADGAGLAGGGLGEGVPARLLGERDRAVTVS